MITDPHVISISREPLQCVVNWIPTIHSILNALTLKRIRRRRYVDDWVRQSWRRSLEEILEGDFGGLCLAKKSQKKRPPKPISRGLTLGSSGASLGVDVQTGLRLTVDYFFDLRLTVDFGFGLSTNYRLWVWTFD